VKNLVLYFIEISKYSIKGAKGFDRTSWGTRWRIEVVRRPH